MRNKKRRSDALVCSLSAMRAAFGFAALVLASGFIFAAGSSSPEWAYGVQNPPVQRPAEERDNTPRHIEGSDLTFTKSQINDPFGPADWFPGDHPKMPEIVSNGRKPAILACALCHLPNGKGRPENASVVGFTHEYFVNQMHEFRDGNRNSADSRKGNTKVMIRIAKAMTDEEIEASAKYFCAMKWTPWVKVQEATEIPKMYTAVGLFLPLPGNEKEPLGDRIIETPQNVPQAEGLRNPHSGFLAYVPRGSVAKGKQLVTNGEGKTACGVCHGVDLKGLGPVPGIAGRSPSYLVRQLYDIQQGTRKGDWNELMKPVVEKLSNEDMLNIAAYTASLEP
jgi:cytochrome c553